MQELKNMAEMQLVITVFSLCSTQRWIN